MAKLSIITPCYNSIKTLEETVSSVFTQNLTIPFELILVDDGSTDGTKELIKKIADGKENVSYIFHEKNMGGGAARNTGIRQCTGDLIFCLDSDNFFPPNILQKMVDFLISKKCDGVVIEERRFFVGNKSSKYTSHFNNKKDQPIILDDLFNSSGVLLDNFLFKKQAYEKIGGYPENHGFDTQCFEHRFLSSGCIAYVCPGSVFYHRQSSKMDSYFQRVYKDGLFSLNLYLIYEDIFHLFSEDVKKLIIEFDIFKNSRLDSKNLKAVLDEAYANNPQDFFIKDKDLFYGDIGRKKYLERNIALRSVEDIFASAVINCKNGNYQVSLKNYTELLSKGFETKIVHYNILRTCMAMNPKHEHVKIEDDTISLIQSMNLNKQKLSRIKFLIGSFYNKLKK